MTKIAVLLGVVTLVAGCSQATSVGAVNVGDCFDDPGQELVTEIQLIDCGQPHDNEVYAAVLMDDGSWPGTDAVTNYAVDACLDQFEPYVGVSYADSPLDYFYLSPTQASWAQGDQRVLCVLYQAGLEKLTGSQRANG